jgi:hypothetical protein
MRDQISAAVRPLDFLEKIWVNDVVNLVWETLRLRRLRAAPLQSAAPDSIYRVMSHLPDYCSELATNWASREPDSWQRWTPISPFAQEIAHAIIDRIVRSRFM